jgi:hypothetical protein
MDLLYFLDFPQNKFLILANKLSNKKLSPKKLTNKIIQGIDLKDKRR